LVVMVIINPLAIWSVYTKSATDTILAAMNRN
jgi:hypothetical protein